tara:strand:+ start:751 stop:1122 length:372 start_codon:yes stop_codon:yes gene_type:complete
MRFVVLFLCLLSGYASAHQFTPTYPTLELSHITGVYKAEMLLFNTRKEIRYYSLNVFDEEWNPVRFASGSKLIPMDYQERKYVDIYISKKDVKKAKYICSKSKILKSIKDPSIVASRICSKIK